MSELNNESIQSASFVTAQTHISASNSQSSQWPSTQIEPRAIAAAQEVGGQIRTLTSSQPSFGSTTQIEPRVVAYEAALALEEEREAARLAAISKPPTTKEIATLLVEARRDRSVRDARLIITSTHIPDDASPNSSIIPLSYKTKNRVTFGVVQQPQDVDLKLYLPLDDSYTTAENYVHVECQIIYDPQSDDCLFINYTTLQLLLTNFSSSPALPVPIGGKKSHLLQPGMWRITIPGGDQNPEGCHLAEFWLLGRQFDISIRTAHNSMRTKRGIDGGAEENVNKRRKRNNNLAGNTLSRPIYRTITEIEAAAIAIRSTDDRNLALTASTRNIPDKTTVSLLDLADGEEANIQARRDRPDRSQSVSAAKGPASYQLRRVKHIAATGSASVFHCIHSSTLVVAKVLRLDRKSPLISPSLWKTEKTTLEKLKHRNIVALKAFDGRMLAMYLEPLPTSLYRGPTFKYSQSAIETILRDISSALVYLKTIPIVHNDIKPRNITYSPRRGAVLIDFGLATTYSEVHAGGTPWYLPPDLLEDKTRGSPGDIWALGITMLYLLGKIAYPEENPEKKSELRGWPLHNLLHNEESQRQMWKWLQRISSARATLIPVDRGTGISKLESIVFHMVEVDKDMRFNAEEIVSALG